MQAANFQQRVFRVKVAEETYDNEARIKVSMRDTEPVNYTDESGVRGSTELSLSIIDSTTPNT